MNHHKHLNYGKGYLMERQNRVLNKGEIGLDKDIVDGSSSSLISIKYGLPAIEIAPLNLPSSLVFKATTFKGLG